MLSSGSQAVLQGLEGRHAVRLEPLGLNPFTGLIAVFSSGWLNNRSDADTVRQPWRRN